MPDIADQFDAAIGAAPNESPALDPILVLGRGALRRRRLAYGVGAVATALVIGGTAWAVSPSDGGPGRSEEPGFVGEWTGEEAARLQPSGRIVVKPGWSVSADMAAVGGWSAVEVENGDRRQWFLFSSDGETTISDLDAPAPGYEYFEDWVDANAPASDDEGAGDPEASVDLDLGAPLGVPRDDLVRFIPRFVSLARGLEPVDDTVKILDQRFNPVIGDDFAPPRNTGAVEVRKDGLVWYVVARRPGDFIAVAASQAWALDRVKNLDDFIDFARERYAEGGGGLL